MARRLVPRLALVAAAIACALLAAVHPDTRSAQGLELTAARGAVEIASSREGKAILSARNIRPGQSVSGSLAIVNRGGEPVRLLLRSSRPRGAAGPNGGRLADVLRVRIQDSTRRRTVADGRLAAIAGCHDLGELEPGASRRFSLVARFPAGGRGDNLYARANATVDERWIASRADCAGKVPRLPRALRPRLAISHRHVVIRRGRARLRVLCRSPRRARCTGTLGLRPTNLSSRLQAARSGAVPFDVAGRAAGTLHVRIPAASARRLQRRGKAVALAIVRPARGTSMLGGRRYITLIDKGGR